jgi:hypothetical protein
MTPPLSVSLWRPAKGDLHNCPNGNYKVCLSGSFNGLGRARLARSAREGSRANEHPRGNLIMQNTRNCTATQETLKIFADCSNEIHVSGY